MQLHWKIQQEVAENDSCIFMIRMGMFSGMKICSMILIDAAGGRKRT